jgi:hypothetical protein
VATLLDVRRTEAYDAAKAVDTLLDSAALRAWMGASNQVGGHHSTYAQSLKPQPAILRWGPLGSYDAAKSVDRLLDSAEVRAWMGA